VKRPCLVLALVGLTAVMAYAGARQSPQTARPSSSADEPPRAARARPGRALSEVTTVYEADSSAYHARLVPYEEGVIFVSPESLTLLRTGKAPEEHPVSLGSVAARQGDSMVFWRDGKLRQVSLSGEDERELVTVKQPPQFLLASENRLAWIAVDRTNGSSLRILSDRGAQTVHQTEEVVCAAIMRDATVYLVLQSREGSWRIGGVPLGGGKPTFTPARTGRPPAMLALGPAGIYFYAGPQQGVRTLTFDLEHDAPVMPNVICSPLAVSSSDSVVCAHVGGIFDVPASRSRPRFLALERAGPVTAVVASGGRAFWIAESGDAQLVVRSLELPL
jgi:hypothetical protein